MAAFGGVAPDPEVDGQELVLGRNPGVHGQRRRARGSPPWWATLMSGTLQIGFATASSACATLRDRGEAPVSSGSRTGRAPPWSCSSSRRAGTAGDTRVVARWGTWVLFGLLLLGALMNVASSSVWERYSWGTLRLDPRWSVIPGGSWRRNLNGVGEARPDEAHRASGGGWFRHATAAKTYWYVPQGSTPVNCDMEKPCRGLRAKGRTGWSRAGPGHSDTNDVRHR